MTLDYKAIYLISAQYIKACRKKVRKTNILNPKRGITHSKIAEIPGNMNLICDTSLQSLIQNFKVCKKKVRKTRTDGRREGHDHTIIRNVFKKRSYKNQTLASWSVWEKKSVLQTRNTSFPIVLQYWINLFPLAGRHILIYLQ